MSIIKISKLSEIEKDDIIKIRIYNEDSGRTKGTRFYDNTGKSFMINYICSVSSFKNIVDLNISCGSIKFFPKKFLKLEKLKKLDISHNKIQTIDSICDLTLLEYFCCRNNEIEIIPEIISNLSNLTSLDISKNSCVEELPDSFYVLAKLQNLNISDTDIEELSDKMSNFVNLQKLDISFTFVNIPDDIWGLKQITHLNMARYKDRFCDILPKKLFNLKHLKYLNISYNIYGNIFKNVEITESTNLEELITTGCKCKVPDFVFNSSKFRSILMNDTCNYKIPENIFDLTNLEILMIDGNKLSQIDEKIGNLSKLEILTLSDNNITELPKTIEKLTNLKKLKLNSNKLTKLNDGIGNLVGLTELYCKYNEITFIPQSINNLTNLVKLNLCKNIHEMGISNLNCLRSLNKINNQSLNAQPFSFLLCNKVMAEIKWNIYTHKYKHSFFCETTYHLFMNLFFINKQSIFSYPNELILMIIKQLCLVFYLNTDNGLFIKSA